MDNGRKGRAKRKQKGEMEEETGETRWNQKEMLNQNPVALVAISNWGFRRSEIE